MKIFQVIFGILGVLVVLHIVGFIAGYLYEKHKEAKHPEQRVPKGQKTTEELDLVKEVLSEEKNKYKEDSAE